MKFDDLTYVRKQETSNIASACNQGYKKIVSLLIARNDVVRYDVT